MHQEYLTMVQPALVPWIVIVELVALQREFLWKRNNSFDWSTFDSVVHELIHCWFEPFCKCSISNLHSSLRLKSLWKLNKIVKFLSSLWKFLIIFILWQNSGLEQNSQCVSSVNNLNLKPKLLTERLCQLIKSQINIYIKKKLRSLQNIFSIAHLFEYLKW